jgi:hypothetical protein
MDDTALFIIDYNNLEYEEMILPNDNSILGKNKYEYLFYQVDSAIDEAIYDIGLDHYLLRLNSFNAGDIDKKKTDYKYLYENDHIKKQEYTQRAFAYMDRYLKDALVVELDMPTIMRNISNGRLIVHTDEFEVLNDSYGLDTLSLLIQLYDENREQIKCDYKYFDSYLNHVKQELEEKLSK